MYYVLFQLFVLYAALSRGRDHGPPGPPGGGGPPPGFGGGKGGGGGGGGGGGFGGPGGPPGFPACANTCLQKFRSGGNIGNCDAGDSQCICNDQQVQTGTNCCVANTCSPDDQGKATKFVQGLCGPFGVTNAGVCPNAAAAPSQPAPAPVTVSAPAPPPVTVSAPPPDPITVSEPAPDPVTVPVPVSVTVPATLTSVVLQTSILTSSSLVVVTSVGTDSAAASSTVLETTNSVEFVTTVLSSTDVETTDTPSTSIFQSVSTPTSIFIPATSSPATALSSSSTTQTTHGMSSGAKAGIAIAVLLAVGILATIPFFLWRRRRQAKDREFSELKEAHEASVVRPTSRVVPLYPRAVVTGGGYRDVFDRPDGLG